MKERPILFSGQMVRAILAGKKTQTRRIVKPQPPKYIDELHGNELRKRAPYDVEHYETGHIVGCGFVDDDNNHYLCRYGTRGDRLWVRETFGLGWEDGCGGYSALRPTGEQCDRPDKVFFKADFSDDDEKNGKRCWRSSIHMPRWASRITLEVVAVRVERLQDITEHDAACEGFERSFEPDGSEYGAGLTTVCEAFAALWHKINGPDSWSANPWVWVVEFKRFEKGGA